MRSPLPALAPTAWLLALLPFAGVLLPAQAEPEPPAAPQEPAAPAAAGPQADERLTLAELEALVAPIALAPDVVLAAVLPASTDPLHLVKLARWVAAQPGAIEEVPADAGFSESVVALVQFPDLLAWMNENLDWVESLGWAVVQQPEDVLKAIQSYRAKAAAAGNLVSGAELKVSAREAEAAPAAAGATSGTEVIVVESAQPEVVYVPVYDPVAVVEPAPAGAPAISFAAGVAVGVAGAWLWHELVWDDWHVHVVAGPRAGRRDVHVHAGSVNVGNDVNIGNDVNVGNDLDLGNRVGGSTRWQPVSPYARPGARRPTPRGAPAPRPAPYRPPAGAARRPSAPGGVRPPQRTRPPSARPGDAPPPRSPSARPTPLPVAPAFGGDDRGPAARADGSRGRASLGETPPAGPPPSSRPSPAGPPPRGPSPSGPAPAGPAPGSPRPAQPEARPAAPAPLPAAPAGGAFGGAGDPGTRRASDRGGRSLRPDRRPR